MTSWDDLRVFLAVARAGSASAAVRALGLSQPTVSRRLAALARELGVELLRAGARGYTLTTAGERLRGQLERVDRAILAAQRAVDRLDARPLGAVRLTAPEGLGLLVVAPRLEAFRREHPGIDLVLVAESNVANLSRREADLALRFVRPRQRELVMRRLATVPFAPYASPRYLRGRPRDAGAAIVAGDELVALHESLESSPDSAWLRAHAPQQRVRVRVHTQLALRAALLAGAGVGILPDYLGDVPGLRRLGTGPALERDLFLVYHRALRSAERVQIVARFVASCVERRRPGEGGGGGGMT
jgi:DNA-binding transcriptional LysR family regulator